jgi:hypothetical protein
MIRIMYGQIAFMNPVYYTTFLIFIHILSFGFLIIILIQTGIGIIAKYYYAWNPYPFSDIEITSSVVTRNLNNNYNYVNYRRNKRLFYTIRKFNSYMKDKI